MYKRITPLQAKEMMNDKNKIIDVREEDEYNEGHIKDAIHIPLSTLESSIKQIDDKNQTLLVYCRSGRRSEIAAKKLIQLGYHHTYDFGGILDWPYDIIK